MSRQLPFGFLAPPAVLPRGGRSEVAGQRAVVVMSLLQWAKLNGHDRWACQRDVLARRRTHLNSRIADLLPHGWQPVED